MKLARDLLLLLLGAVIGNVLMSHAGSFGIGACRLTGLDEGVWWQQQFDGYKSNQNSACVEAEWRQEGNAGFSVGFAHLGYLHGNNLATINDTTYATKTYTGGECKGDGTNCLARFLVDVADYGVTLGGFKNFGRLSLEGGLFVYRSEFDVTVQRINDPQSGYPLLAEYRITAYHTTPYLGIAYNLGEFYGRLRLYQNINQDGKAYPYKGLTSGLAIALTGGINF